MTINCACSRRASATISAAGSPTRTMASNGGMAVRPANDALSTKSRSSGSTSLRTRSVSYAAAAAFTRSGSTTVTTMSRALKCRAQAAARCSATFECSEKSTGHTIVKELDMTTSLRVGDTLGLTLPADAFVNSFVYASHTNCVGFSTPLRRRIRDPDVYACSDSSNRDSPQSSEGVVTGSGGREPSRLVSAHPGVSRRQWSQRSLSRSGNRTIVSSCPSKRHRIENRISLHTLAPHGRVLSSTARARAEPAANRRVDTCIRATTHGQRGIGTRS